MSRENASRVISMAEHVARRDRSGQTTRLKASHPPPAKEDTRAQDPSTGSPLTTKSSTIIPFPPPWHPLPAA